MTWVIVLAVAAGSYLIRASMLVLTSRQPPAWLTARIDLVAPAALGALLVSGLHHDPGVPAIAACIAAFAVVRRTGDVNHALLVGFPTLWALTFVAG